MLDIEYWCGYCAVTRSSGCGGGRVWAAHCTLGIVIHICYLGPDYRLWMWGSGSWAWVWRPLAPLSIISIIYSSCQYAWETRPTGAGACLIVKTGYIQGQHYVHSDAIIAMILDLISFYIEKWNNLNSWQLCMYRTKKARARNELFQNLAHGLLKQAECLHEEHFTLHTQA